ncbi:small GTP-binding protein [[Leptolyngbya] sp. PCC 7376]|uniref:COR domain-containing protein n=1 Tax=[Leptolyngbya] sp. PCC 7376 TaxID=111781 RepID=UPI00029EE181|nr:COR domain-containing protein [[Leptolyngbya] sp. PCC 7376]AFY40133.1 small GTP-binding protein [[Leptolyngbya] sp. PCC 7376]
MVTEDILQLIKRAAAEGWKTLDLSTYGLRKIPEEITELKNLQQLNLWGNKIRNIPWKITNLNNLQRLNLRHNKIRNFPEEITNLKNLQQLDLSDNQTLEIPETITKLRNLKKLNISNNQIRYLSHTIAELKNLQQLDLSNNKIKEIPKGITELNNLQKLCLSNNKIKEIPVVIASLRNIQQLYLNNNEIMRISPVIAQLPKLQVLDIRGNQIKIIPKFLCDLPNLNTLIIRDIQNINPVKIPPPEIAFKGIDAIRNYYKQLTEQGVDHLYAAKLLVVGEAGAGKTTLTNKIQDPDCSLDTMTTHGIDIHPWTFPYNNHEFQVNIWDFGGQEIYHATHQFFLTQRSLYILVTDERKEDTDFDYWLNIIELLGKDSPIVVAQNQRDGRTRKIDIRGLKGRFENIKDIIATDLKTGTNLDELIKQLCFQLSNLPHVGDRLPKIWVKIRDFLQDNPRNYVSLKLFLSLCKKAGFKASKDSLQLSHYLHDLGIILHFQDDPLLKKTVILNPEWGTTAVYQILDNKKVKDNFGLFSRADLSDIWQDPEYQQMADELLQLMLKFKLCYQLPQQPDIFLAPELLNPEKPDYSWQPDANLIVRYEYEFMPKGILTTLIVEMNQWLKSQDLVWRNGIILQAQDTEAEIIETYSKREIRIRVRGQQKRDLLIKITHELDKIHQTFPGIKYKKLVPCNCSKTCRDSSEPHFYDDKILKQFMADGQPIQCQKSYQMINVRNLLDDVIARSSKAEKPEISRQHDTTSEPQYIEKQYIFQSSVNDPNFFGGDKLNQSNSKFGMGVNEGSIGSQARVAGEYNANGSDLSEITAMIQAMCVNVTAFPKDTRDDLLDEIEDFEAELAKQKEQPNSKKLVRRLKAIALAIPVIDAPTAEILDFAYNIVDLAEKVEPTQTEAIRGIIQQALPSADDND